LNYVGTKPLHNGDLSLMSTKKQPKYFLILFIIVIIFIP